MKTFGYTFLLILLSFSSKAQTFLDHTNSGYQIYDTFSLHLSEMSYPTITGSNAMWGYDTLLDNVQFTFSILPPAATPKDSFLLANVAATSGNGNYTYYKSDASGIEVQGQYVNGTIFQYTNPEVVLPFPFAFGYSHSDAWSVVAPSIPSFSRSGTTNIVADGYGTLQLPNGTYANVTRIKTNQDYKDYNNGLLSTSYLGENITWYLPNVHYQIANYSTFKIDTFPIVRSTQYQDPIVAPTSVKNIQTLERFITFYPNPVQNIITIEGKQTGQYHIELTDLNGKILVNEPIDARIQLDLSHFANGNYLLHLTKGPERIAGELITVKH